MYKNKMRPIPGLAADNIMNSSLAEKCGVKTAAANHQNKNNIDENQKAAVERRRLIKLDLEEMMASRLDKAITSVATQLLIGKDIEKEIIKILKITKMPLIAGKDPEFNKKIDNIILKVVVGKAAKMNNTDQLAEYTIRALDNLKPATENKEMKK